MFQHISWLWIFSPRLPQSSNQRRILWNRRCYQCRWKRCDNFLDTTHRQNKLVKLRWDHEVRKGATFELIFCKSFSPWLPIYSSCRTRCKQDKLLHLENAEVKQGSLSSQCVPQSKADSCHICSPTQPNKQTRFSLLRTMPKISIQYYSIPLKSTAPSSNSTAGISWEFGGYTHIHLLLRFKGDANASTGSECGHHSLKALNTAGGIAPWLPPPGCAKSWDELALRKDQNLRLVVLFSNKNHGIYGLLDISHFQTNTMHASEQPSETFWWNLQFQAFVMDLQNAISG